MKTMGRFILFLKDGLDIRKLGLYSFDLSVICGWEDSLRTSASVWTCKMAQCPGKYPMRSYRFWDFKAESHYIWEKTYITDVSKRTYFQNRFLWGFRLVSRLNFMGMLENMIVYSYISLIHKYSVNSNRCGFLSSLHLYFMWYFQKESWG